ncbi:MAG TPA: lipopolysaccharide assembly protein LapA domain-containing protein [Trebonia sp.]
MAQERQGTAEETATVPDQRAETAPEAPPAEETPPTGEAPPTEPGRPPEQTTPPTAPHVQHGPHDHKIRHTRLSGTWAAVIAFGIVLLLLLIFILQNQNQVEVSYFGAHGHMPLGVSLLLAAVAGILLVALAGSGRIMQLRATARKHRRAHEKARR